MASTFPTLDISKPDATVQTLAQMGASMRDMETFVRASCVIGTLPGYALTISGGTADRPVTCVYSRPGTTEQIKQTITWGTTGGALGNPDNIVHEYSSDSGGTWAKMYSTQGKQSFTYDASGNCTGISWS